MPTRRTTVRRAPDRGVYEREAVHAILDAGRIAHVGFVHDDQPYVIPMAYARDGERLLLHGSGGSRMMRALARGAPACVTVTILDGLVLARRVQMTQMPELIAILHSLVGLAAVLVGFANFLDPAIEHVGTDKTIHDVETYLGILIGAVTFSGSVIAFGKLSGKIGGKRQERDRRQAD